MNSDEILNFYFSLRYFVPNLKKMRVELLCDLLKQFFPTIKFNIILVNHQIIGSLFKHKDTLNKVMSSAVTYIYQCPKCGAQYVGSKTSLRELPSTPELASELVCLYPSLPNLTSATMQ